MKEELITIENGQMIINNNIAFGDLYLEIYKNETTGIIFDNVKESKYILDFFKGKVPLSDGRIFIESKVYDYEKALSFLKNNIAIIDNQNKLVEVFSIEENIFLFADNNNVISYKNLKVKMETLLSKFKIDIETRKPVSSLGTKNRIIIELLRAYYEDKKLVVFDNISSVLTSNEFSDVCSILEELKKNGMTFIMIEYFNNFVFKYVNSFILIQGGKTTGIFESNSYNIRKLFSILTENAKAKVNSDNSINYKMEKKVKDRSVSAFKFNNVSTSFIQNLNLELQAGEILNLICMDDISGEHIINLLKGKLKPVSGEITLRGNRLDINSIENAIDKGICFIEEEAYKNSLSYNMTVRDNIGLVLSKKAPFFWMKSRYKKSIDQIIKQSELEDCADMKVKDLEPSSLQILLYLRWYLYAPKVMVCVKPFAQLDINLQEITRKMIMLLKSRGISVLILTDVLSGTHNMRGDNIYIQNGRKIDKDKVYNLLFDYNK